MKKKFENHDDVEMVDKDGIRYFVQWQNGSLFTELSRFHNE